MEKCLRPFSNNSNNTKNKIVSIVYAHIQIKCYKINKSASLLAFYLELSVVSEWASGRCSESPEEHREVQNSEEPQSEAAILERR